MHVSYAAGGKLKESGWSPAETETVIGFVDFDRHLDSLGAWLAAKLLVGSAGEVPDFVVDPDADSSGTAEFCLGLRTYGSWRRVEPFASLGLALLTAGVTGYDEGAYDAFGIDEEVALGGWVDVGFQVPLTPSLVVGVVVHHSVSGEVDLDAGRVELGGTSLLLTLGARR
jgi:hypothetical protein